MLQLQSPPLPRRQTCAAAAAAGTARAHGTVETDVLAYRRWAGVRDAEACFDTKSLDGTGAGWAQRPPAGSHPIPMRYLQRFVAWQSAAIHAADPGALTTVGSWNAKADTDADGHFNYWAS